MDNRRYRFWSQGLKVVALIAAVLAIAPGSPAAAGEPLTLRINDAMAVPGARMALVLRTYAPRGVGQGQICLNVRSRGPGNSPLVALEGAAVFSQEDDAEVDMAFDGPAQMAMVAFSSASGTINWADGALAVFFFRLDGALAPGQTFIIDLDPAGTFLIDAEKQNIPLDLRGGDLTVRAPGAPMVVAAEGDNVTAGSVAALGVETSQLLPLRLGQVALRWDPAAASGPPVVTMDPRHGAADYTVDLTVPGRALVAFLSPDGSLNEVPGKIVSVDLPTASNAPPSSLVTLDPVLTYIVDASGLPLQVELIADLLEIRVQSLVFADGFESGGIDEWPIAVP
jgi:hypothetical protein